MPLWLQFIIIVSVLSGIGFLAFAMWFGVKQQQAKIGTSMRDLVDTVARQQKALEVAEKRFQNLETIVTSQVWDRITDDGPTDARVTLDIPEVEPSSADRAAQIARRVKT